MSNIINYVNKTNIIDQRLEQLNNKLHELKNNDEISEEELLYTIKSSIVKIFNDIGKPTYKFNEAITVPILPEYQEMVNTAINDITSIIEDGLNLNTAQKNAFINNQMFSTMVSSKLNHFSKKLKNIEQNINTDFTYQNNIMITETFSNNNNSADVSGSLNQANINTDSGILTLGLKRQSNNIGGYIDILEGSNGFPGNTHIASKINNEVVFDGENNLHMDLNEMIDGKEDTWFEYEIFEIPDNIYESIGGLGTEYSEGVSWITDNKKLTLKFRVTLKKPDNYNMITISPYWPNIKGSKTPVIKNITVMSADKSDIQTVISSQLFNDNIVIIFKHQEVKYIEAEIEQTIGYLTDIGHFFYSKENIYENENTASLVRVQGKNPSVSNLNIKYNPTTKTLSNPKSYDETGKPAVINSDEVKDNLFNLHQKSHNCSKEIIQAKRYAIGIKDINVSSCQFYETSVYISDDFKAKDVINTISLDVEEYIPLEYVIPHNYIKYYISIDEGKEWLPIFPRYRGYAGPSTYKINSSNIKYVKDSNVKYIYKLMEPTTVRIKIELARPINMPYSTPIVYAYTLNMKIGDEDID